MELLFILAPFAVSAAGTGLLIRWAGRRGLVDVPNERSSHEVPVPRLGGTALFWGFAVGFVLLVLLRPVPLPPARVWVSFAAGALALWVVGTLDDLRGLPPVLRLLVQIGAALCLVWGGLGFESLRLPSAPATPLAPLEIPLTVIWVLVFVNFYNFVDGIDGLAGGGAVIAGGFLFLYCLHLGLPFLGLAGLALAASTLGFLRYNFPPARIFMGDGGSTFLGYFFAFAGLYGLRSPEWGGGRMPPLLVVLLLGALLADAAVTLARRILKGDKWYRPHRTHYYQRLVSLGLSHAQVVLIFYAVSVLLGGSAFAYLKGDQPFAITLAGIWVVLLSMGMMKVRSMERGSRMFWERRTLLVIGSDLAFFAAAYLLAFGLRLNFTTPTAEVDAMWKGLPIVLGVRSFSFYYYRIYRRSWRLTSGGDLVLLGKAVTLGTILSAMAMWFLFRLESFPRSVFGIEWFILMVLVTGSRVGVRLFYEMTGREGWEKVLVVGAGRRGHLAVQELRHPASGRRAEPVGFLDDDEKKRDISYDGVPVLGRCDQVVPVSRSLGVGRVVLALPARARKREMEVRRRCRKADLAVDRMPAPRTVVPLGSGPAPEVLEDLVLRPPAASAEARAMVAGRTVLIAGGGGPLGRSLAREARRLGARRVVVADRDEGKLRAAGSGSDPLETALCDLRDEGEAARLVASVRPGLVVYLAGYEREPACGSRAAFFANNLLAPLAAARLAQEVEASFVFRSRPEAAPSGRALDAAAWAVESSLPGEDPPPLVRAVRLGTLLDPDGEEVRRIRRALEEGGEIRLPRAWRDRFRLTTGAGARLLLEAAALPPRGRPVVASSLGPFPFERLLSALAAGREGAPGADLQIRWEGAGAAVERAAREAAYAPIRGDHLFEDRSEIPPANPGTLLDLVRAADEEGLERWLAEASRPVALTRRAGA
jgi:UDP-GlcNAc:undecaprenyl-phosphate GlcNAc-1-phosphate transferase